MDNWDKKVVFPLPDAPVKTVSSPFLKPLICVLKKLKYWEAYPYSLSKFMILCSILEAKACMLKTLLESSHLLFSWISFLKSNPYLKASLASFGAFGFSVSTFWLSFFPKSDSYNWLDFKSMIMVFLDPRTSANFSADLNPISSESSHR